MRTFRAPAAAAANPPTVPSMMECHRRMTKISSRLVAEPLLWESLGADSHSEAKLDRSRLLENFQMVGMPGCCHKVAGLCRDLESEKAKEKSRPMRGN